MVWALDSHPYLGPWLKRDRVLPHGVTRGSGCHQPPCGQAPLVGAVALSLLRTLPGPGAPAPSQARPRHL